MKKIEQTRYGAPGGNCFQACIASLLERDLDDVPDFMNDIGDIENPEDQSFVLAIRDYLRSEGLDLYLVPFEWVLMFDLDFDGVVTGLTENGVDHSVVYVDGSFAWNPGGPDEGDLHEGHLAYVIVGETGIPSMYWLRPS